MLWWRRTWWEVGCGGVRLLKLPRLALSRLVILFAALVVGYFIFAATENIFLSQRLDRDEQRLQQEIAELQRQQVELEAIRGYLQTDEYIEGIARRVLGLVRPGETLVIVSSSVAPTPTPEGQPAGDARRPWWEIVFDP